MTRSILSDLHGPIGPQGIPGTNAVPADTAVAGYISTAGTSATKTALMNRGPSVNVKDYGALGDGTTDDTAALQAALNATTVGNTCFVPPVAAGLNYKFTTLTIPHGVTLEGGGWKFKRDNIQAFGGVNNTDPTTYYGSVLRSTASSGAAITTSASAFTGQSGSLRDILVTGPGTGTATGVVMGTATGASGAYEATWQNVGIVNFYSGAIFTSVEDCDFYGLRIMASTNALTLQTGSNQNSFVMLDIQRCGTGLVMDSSSLANGFYSPIFQANTGVSATLNGSQSVMVNPYFENPAGTLALKLFGYGHRIETPVLSNPVDGITLDAATTRCHISGIAILQAATIVNAGSGNLFTGDTSTLADTGSRTVVIDGYNDKSRFGNLTIGDRTNTTAERFVSVDLATTGAGGSGGVQFNVGGATKWKHYIAASDGTRLYLRDEANAKMLVTYQAGATPQTSKVLLNGVLQLPYVPSASRPTAAAAGVGGSIYDATIQCPIWSDGVNWRNGAGTIV